MKKLLLISIILATYFTPKAYSQASRNMTTLDLSAELFFRTPESSAAKLQNIDGSPYLNENFKPVRINGNQDKLYYGRINAFNGDVEIELSDKVIALDENTNYEVLFVDSNNLYKTFTYTSADGVTKNGFFNAISISEKLSLLKKDNVKYYEKMPAPNSYQKGKPARFVKTKPNYYLKRGNVIREFPNRKKDLLKSYPKEDEKKIKSFLKENKISFNEEEDIIKLTTFLATL